MAPAFGLSAWASEEGASTNLIWLVHEDGSAEATKDPARASAVLHFMEWNMVREAIGRAVRRRQQRRAAKARLMRKVRRGW